jgi:transposase-like protein
MNTKETPIPKKQYRKWTLEQKMRMLAEAKLTSVHGTATRNDIAATQLFRWRKTLQSASSAPNPAQT